MYAVKSDQLEIVIELADTDIVEFSKTNKVSDVRSMINHINIYMYLLITLHV